MRKWKNSLMISRIALYTALVNKAPGIRERYEKRRKGAKGAARAGAWGYLLLLNFAYVVLRRRDLGEGRKQAVYEKKTLYQEGPESGLSMRESPKELAKRLAAYDVISFDVFDTLLFRPFSQPSDLFYFVAKKLDYPDFKEIRREMEQRARRNAVKRGLRGEVKLTDIYELMEQETGIGREEGMQAELETEHRFCFANPYMLQVIKALRRHGKRIVAVSDMYLGREQIQELLSCAGYDDFDAYYISCEYGRGKHDGGLYEIVKEREEIIQKGGRLIHVGDHMQSDVEQAKKHGFDAVYYQNVNEAGMRYRPEDMSAITGSVYRGIVNVHLHNGLAAYSLPYEYGFVYGGLFAVGYCQFIYEQAKRRHIEKVLFLSRDGDILSKVYKKLYPEEKQEYVYWSRLAAAKLTASRYKYDYFRRFLCHKVNKGYTLGRILEAMELTDMLPLLQAEEGLKREEALTDRNVERIKVFFNRHWERVTAHYKGQLKAAGQYYEEVLRGVHSAAAVDIGWAGSGAISLSYLVQKVWKMNCEMIGILAGTNSCHTFGADGSEPQLAGEQLVSYLFSQTKNRDLWKFHDPGKGHNLYWELLASSQAGSLKGFYPKADGGYRIVLKDADERAASVREIHQGILDFTELYQRILGDERPPVGGRDAYAPMLLAEQEQNRGYLRRLAGMLDQEDVE